MKFPRLAALFGFSILLVGVTRLPYFPPHLFSFDSVNLALALEHFDPTLHQPQPPGYPLFVLEARLVNLLFGNAERTFAVLGVLICGLAVAMLYLVGKELFSPWAGMVAAALLFVNPAFWYSSLTSPLRPHLALVSAAVAYFCWQAKRGERRPLYAASLALGVGGGARPELFVLLLPLWIWAAWQTRERKAVVWSALLLGGAALVWAAVLLVASGGPRMIAYFAEYALAETESTSVVLNPATSWRRAAGRAVIWTGLGAVPWIWALPFGWFGRLQLPQWSRRLLFLTVWFVPAFSFHLLVHVGDPDHALSAIPAVAVLGGFCLQAVRDRIGVRWIAGALVSMVLLGNILLFFVQFPFPQGPAAGGFRGLASVKDAFLVATYESSYNRVRFVAQRTTLGLKGIADLKSTTDRPVLVLWARDGEPSWRKISYYLPSENMYVLGETGDPGASAAEARYYSGSHLVTRHTGPPPFQLSVPRNARLIWVAGGDTVASLQEILPLQKFSTLHYADLPAGSPSIRWGSFELVPE